MKAKADLASCTLRLLSRTVLVSANFVAVIRNLSMNDVASSTSDPVVKENALLRDKILRLESLVEILRSQLDTRAIKRQLTIKERFLVVWHVKAFNVPRLRWEEYFGIARSTIDRWLRDSLGKGRGGNEPANKTPKEIAALVWKLFERNPHWGKLRVAQQMALLKIFIAASTVRNILRRPRPKKTGTVQPIATKKAKVKSGKRDPAKRPNQVWSADLTVTKVWGLWSVYVFVMIDHFSRKLMAVVPLKNPNAACVRDAFSNAIETHGKPAILITDHGSAFTAHDLDRFLAAQSISHELGAIGEPTSIALTERQNRTLKSEWLRRAFVIRGFDHLAELCPTFEDWYNNWRPHQGISGNRPADAYASGRIIPFAPVDRSKHKTVPQDIEQVSFAETRTTAWRTARCA